MTNDHDQEWEFISDLRGDMKVVFTRLDTIENNHLAHMQEDITKLDGKLWAILMIVFAQLFAIVGGMFAFWLMGK